MGQASHEACTHAEWEVPDWVHRIGDGRCAPFEHLTGLDGSTTFCQLAPSSWLFHRGTDSVPVGMVEQLEQRMMASAMTLTFGPAPYVHGQRYEHIVVAHPDDAPELVAFCLRNVVHYLPPGVDCKLYQTAIVQYYRAGSTHLPMHYDDVHPLLAGLPIVSFTFLPRGSLPRVFAIAPKRRPGEPVDPRPLHIALQHGDVLVMGGDTQAYFEHGVPPQPGAAYANSRRINVTIHPSAADPMAIMRASPCFTPGCLGVH